MDGQVVVEREFPSDTELAVLPSKSQTAQKEWAKRSLVDRCELVSAFVDQVMVQKEELARELTLQMGRPLSQAPSELRGFEDRARHMISIAETSLASVIPGNKEGFTRYVERAPLGVVLTIAPWNYPYLTAVNSVVPALVAGNSVILKHSPQTPLVAEQLSAAAERAGFPAGLFQHVHASNEQIQGLVRSEQVNFVSFTGSVAGGRALQGALSERFIGLGLELGGKDAAYVCEDADFDHAVENLVDGAFFNSGQSCCGIERIYVHESIFGRFVDAFVALTQQYRLGNPLDDSTNLGPVVNARAAQFVADQAREAITEGARGLIDPSTFPAHQPGTAYLAPQVLTQVTHSMRVMKEESFGPVVGLMPVRGDSQAVELMNDSEFGLTGSVWTQDQVRAVQIGRQVAVGTWFMNRCDALDPALAWTGVKNSGRGCTLSSIGYEALTRPRSFHLRHSL
ncbi:MAG: hypothetical protein RJA70_917 [Pseudomonadota bacterium]